MRTQRSGATMVSGRPATGRRAVRWTLAVATCVVIAAPARAQDSTGAAPGAARPAPRAVRLVLSGGMTVPIGGFATYHDLGVQASGSLLLRLFGQRLRLRPEVVYNRFDVVEAKVRSIVAQVDRVESRQPARLAAGRLASASGRPASSAMAGDPKLPDLTKLRDGAISSLLGTFANIELPLGPQGFQPYLIGGVGAVAFRTDVTTVNEALDGVQWALNAGAGIRFRLGPIGGGLEARFRQIPVDGARTFFDNVTAIPVAFSLIF